MANERQPAAAIPKAFKDALDDVPEDTAIWLEGELTRTEKQLIFEILDFIKPLSEGEGRVWSRREIETRFANQLAKSGRAVKTADINWATTLVVERLSYQGLLVDDPYRVIEQEKRLDLGEFFSFRQGPGPLLGVYETLAEVAERAEIDGDAIANIRMIINSYKAANSS